MSRWGLGRWFGLGFGVLCVGGFGVIGRCIAGPVLDADPTSWNTIYPWWSLVLVLGGVLAGVGALVRPVSAAWQAGAAGAAGVLGAELAGLGVVAAKHWRPAFGMGGGYAGQVDTLERLGVVAFVAGLVVVVASLVRLVSLGELPVATGRRRRLAVLVGTAIVVLLPPLSGAAGWYDNLDATSLGAYVLIYSGPWGVAVVLSGWLRAAAARTVVATAAGCAALALIGPQMIDLASPQPYWAFAAALAALVAGYRSGFPLSRTPARTPS